MIILDLKLVLLLVLILFAGFALSVWRLLQRQIGGRGRPLALDREVWQSLPFGMVVLEPARSISFINERARQLLEYGEADGQPSAKLEQVLDAVLTEQGAELQRSGQLTQPVAVRWWSYPLERRETLLVLADGNEQQRFLRQQQSFVGQLSHELRTPITALMTHAEVAKNQQTSDTMRAASIEIIQREAQRMGRLVRDLLELYRLETTGDLTLQPLNLILIAEEAIMQVFQRAEQARLQLTLDADTPLPAVLGQADRLKQVFLNLLDNAIKYCQPGAAIRVRLSAEPAGVRCSIEDSGPGIASRDLPHVAERLYRARPDVDGSGIGLALVGEILRRHHTSLSIESVAEGEETGTTVCWSLPYARTSQEP